MTKEAVYNIVKDKLTGLFELDPASISIEKKIDDDLGLDSLDMVDLVIAINDEKDLLKEKIEATLFKEVKTVEDIINILSPYMAAAE